MEQIDPRNEFNKKYYMDVNKARDKVFHQILPNLVNKMNLKTAIDVGCGIGYYTSYLSSLGLHVVGIDGREENIKTARSDLPNLDFIKVNIEEKRPDFIETYDLVFCAGLLYHLENPFKAIRNLREMCNLVCVIESRVHWSNSPLALLVRDGDSPSQALDHYAMIVTRRCMINMLYASGFSNVYSVEHNIDHDELKRSFPRKSRRHFFIASLIPISMIGLKYEPISTNEDMTTSTPYKRSVRRFYKSILESFRWFFNA